MSDPKGGDGALYICIYIYMCVAQAKRLSLTWMSIKLMVIIDTPHVQT